MTKSGKKILVLGSTGLVGREVLRELVHFPQMGEAYAWVRSSQEPMPQVHFQLATWEDVQAGKISFPDSLDAVLCCLGTTIRKAGSEEAFLAIDQSYPLAVAKLARQANVPAFLIITALGADPNSYIFYNRVKGAVEKELINLRFPYLGIFRPSLLLGDRQEWRPGEKVAEWVSGFFPFSWLGLQKYAPVSAKKVARSLLKKASETFDPKAIKVEYIESNVIQELGR